MRSIAVILNSITGQVAITITSDVGSQTLDMTWGYDADGDHGFMTSFHGSLIRLTEISAPLFIAQLLAVLRQALEVDEDNCHIMDEAGQPLSDIVFLPPTFLGDSEDIVVLVQAQESLLRVYHIFEQSGRRLTGDLLDFCEREGVLEDFLTLIESKLSGIYFNLDCLKEE